MRVHIQASVAIKNHEGVMSFGTLQWLEGGRLCVRADSYLKTGRDCEVRLELTGTSETVYATARVVEISENAPGTPPSATCQIIRIAAEDRQRLVDWIDEISHSGSLSHPSRWLASRVSGDARRSWSDPGHTPTTHLTSRSRRPVGREAVREALRGAARDRAAGPSRPQGGDRKVSAADPTVEVQPDERRVTVRWRTAGALARDLAAGVRRGRLTLATQLTPGDLFLRLGTPDGQVLALPARAEPSANGCLITFRLSLPLKQKLKRAAGG